MSNCVVRCPFWRPSRAHFGVEVCDNLIDGVPQCIVSHFYPDDPFEYDNIEDYYSVEICKHFVWSDYYSVDEKTRTKHECFFGGTCIHQDAGGFSACFGCSRFKRQL